MRSSWPATARTSPASWRGKRLGLDSPWELAIKAAVGKLVVPPNVADQLSRDGFQELQISSRHGERAGSLPLHHRDPFDRMLIAQAQIERLTIVTADRVFWQYDVDLLDAEL